MDKVNVETVGSMLCLLCEFIAAISLYSFHVSVLLLVPSPSLAASIEN